MPVSTASDLCELGRRLRLSRPQVESVRSHRYLGHRHPEPSAEAVVRYDRALAAVHELLPVPAADAAPTQLGAHLRDVVATDTMARDLAQALSRTYPVQGSPEAQAEHEAQALLVGLVVERATALRPQALAAVETACDLRPTGQLHEAAEADIRAREMALINPEQALPLREDLESEAATLELTTASIQQRTAHAWAALGDLAQAAPAQVVHAERLRLEAERTHRRARARRALVREYDQWLVLREDERVRRTRAVPSSPAPAPRR